MAISHGILRQGQNFPLNLQNFCYLALYRAKAATIAHPTPGYSKPLFKAVAQSRCSKSP